MSNLLRADQVSLSERRTTAWTVHQRAEAQVGDLVAVTFAYGFSALTATPPDGTWTALAVSTQADRATIATFHKMLTVAGAADYTFTGMAGHPYIGHCAVIAGGAPAQTTTSALTATASVAAATPATAGSLVLAAVAGARTGDTVPAPTGTGWRRRSSGLSGAYTDGGSSWLAVYAFDNAPTTAVPTLTFTLPVSGSWAAQTLVFAPNAQPAAALLSDTWSPRAGVWEPIRELVPASGAWV